MKFALVPLFELRDLNLNSTDKLVMGMIASLTIKRKECTASNEFLSLQIQVSKRTILKSLTKLKNKKLISITAGDYQRKIYSNIVWKDTSMGIEENFYTP